MNVYKGRTAGTGRAAAGMLGGPVGRVAVGGGGGGADTAGASHDGAAAGAAGTGRGADGTGGCDVERIFANSSRTGV